jgi:hypothetical protein
MNKAVVITTKTGYRRVGSYGCYYWSDVYFTFSTGEIQSYRYCNDMHTDMPPSIKGLKYPYGFTSFVKGYANALHDQGFDITHIDNSEDNE